MIVVIADDLTGAAEIGGIGLRYGLKVLLSADPEVEKEADLLVIYTNTRSLGRHEAMEVMHDLTMKIAKRKPALFYKKTDSVLRGHVLAEMKVQMTALGLRKALLLPVNPLLGRTIQNGHYYINGHPVHEAGFANDPEFPVKSSEIKAMLDNTTHDDLYLLPITEHLADGITVGEASTMREVRQWASVDEKEIFFAGAASFFAALLHQQFVAKKVDVSPTLALPLLLVSGTTYQQNICKQAHYAGKVSGMPAALFNCASVDYKAVDVWATEVANLLHIESKCIMVIGKQASVNAEPALLRKKMSVVVEQVLQKVQVKELMIEGGSTAYAIIQELGFALFKPTEELQQGVVRMKVIGTDDLYLTIKPGSYAWPETWEKSLA